MSEPVKLPRTAAINFKRLEEDLAEVARAPKPEEVRKTGADVTAQYKLAAQAVLSMSDELHERIRRHDAGLARCHDVLRIVQEASDSIREKGAHDQLVIDESAATCDEICKAVTELLKLIRQ